MCDHPGTAGLRPVPPAREGGLAMLYVTDLVKQVAVPTRKKGNEDEPSRRNGCAAVPELVQAG